MGFVFGLQKDPFPLNISMRHQTVDHMVFDDLLALSSCHLNAIATAQYIPDFRFLLASPQGTNLATTLRDSCIEVFRNQFWDNLQ